MRQRPGMTLDQRLTAIGMLIEGAYIREGCYTSTTPSVLKDETTKFFGLSIHVYSLLQQGIGPTSSYHDSDTVPIELSGRGVDGWLVVLCFNAFLRSYHSGQ